MSGAGGTAAIPHTRECQVGRLPWDEVARRLSEGAVAVLPVGAGAKQHGLHLPMMTDQLIVEHYAHVLACALGSGTDALVWPTLSYGYYPAFVGYRGSVSLSLSAFQQMVAETVTALHGAGARHVVVLDAGLSTRDPIEGAFAARGAPNAASRLGLFEGPRFAATVAARQRQPYGSHADEIETSVMMALFPTLVDMARAVPSPVQAGGHAPGPLDPDDASSPNYAPSGSYGDPTLATAALGRDLVAAITADLVDGVSRALEQLIAAAPLAPTRLCRGAVEP